MSSPGNFPDEDEAERDDQYAAPGPDEDKDSVVNGETGGEPGSDPDGADTPLFPAGGP